MENYLDIQNGSYSDLELKKVANIIKNGGIVLFPTETVYGIGTNGLDSYAVKKLYEIKKRSINNPINLLVSNMDMIENITEDISPIEYKLMEAFFPGPFTIILKKKKIVPDIVTANSEFVGIRMPDNIIARKLVEYAGVPISAPSANISGNLSGTDLDDIIDEFSGNLDYIINGGKSNIGIESTIVKVIDNIPHILRPGFITPEQIKKVVGNVVLENIQNELLPSSNLKHYQLNTKCMVVYSSNTQKMVSQIIDISKKYSHPAIVCYDKNIQFYVNNVSNNYLFPTSFENLFSTLRRISNLSPDVVIIEGVKKEGFGIAIMNRLLNICNNNYIEL